MIESDETRTRNSTFGWAHMSALVLALLVSMLATGGASWVNEPAAASGGALAQSAGATCHRNGDVVSSLPTTVYFDPTAFTPGASPEARIRVAGTARRVVYCSRDDRGRRVAVSSTVIAPRSKWSGPGVQPLLTYGHATVGLGDQCAASKRLSTGRDVDAALLNQFLLDGYAVVVTDYVGLGTPGAHPYLMRRSQGRAVLDAARAAQRVQELNVPDDGPVLAAGFSQGGRATADALELHASYASELDLKGAFAVGLPGDLASLVRHLDGVHDGLLFNVINGLHAAYPEARVLGILNTAGRQRAARAAGECRGEPHQRTNTLTKDGRSLGDNLVRRFAPLLAAQRVGQARPGAPVLQMHSTQDELVPFAPARASAQRWCNLGGDVRFQPLVLNHGSSYVIAYTAAESYFENLLRGTPAPNNCGRF